MSGLTEQLGKEDSVPKKPPVVIMGNPESDSWIKREMTAAEIERDYPGELKKRGIVIND